MGYESKILIGERAFTPDRLTTSEGNTGGYYYVSVIATYDLKKMGGEMWNRLFMNTPLQETKYFFYDWDGNTPILEDLYGAPMKQVGINSLLLALSMDYESDRYRRLPPLIGMLDMFRTQLDQNMWDKETFVVLHYGH